MSKTDMNTLDHLATLAEKALRDSDAELYSNLQDQMARLLERSAASVASDGGHLLPYCMMSGVEVPSI